MSVPAGHEQDLDSLRAGWRRVCEVAGVETSDPAGVACVAALVRVGRTHLDARSVPAPAAPPPKRPAPTGSGMKTVVHHPDGDRVEVFVPIDDVWTVLHQAIVVVQVGHHGTERNDPDDAGELLAAIRSVHEALDPLATPELADGVRVWAVDPQGHVGRGHRPRRDRHGRGLRAPVDRDDSPAAQRGVPRARRHRLGRRRAPRHRVTEAVLAQLGAHPAAADRDRAATPGPVPVTAAAHPQAHPEARLAPRSPAAAYDRQEGPTA